MSNLYGSIPQLSGLKSRLLSEKQLIQGLRDLWWAEVRVGKVTIFDAKGKPIYPERRKKRRRQKGKKS